MILATATDPASPSVVTGPTILLGSGGTGGPFLDIDTQGPTITKTVFRRAVGTIQITFQDSIRAVSCCRTRG